MLAKDVGIFSTSMIASKMELRAFLLEALCKL
jgi:hypothetical protein